MNAAKKPKLIAPLLLVGILILVGVTVLATLLPGAGRAPDRVATASDGAAAGVSRPAGGEAPLRSAAPTAGSGGASAQFVDRSDRLPPAPVLSTVTYTVGPGATRSLIARWFKEHGYAALFAINKEVFASSRKILSPGRRITIRNGVMTVAGPVASPSTGPVDG